MSTLTIITHLIALAFGAAGGGYVGYRWGSNLVKDYQAVRNTQGSGTPPK